MRFKFTNSSIKILDEIKKRVIENYQERNPRNFKIKYTKKKYFTVTVIPYLFPAFILYIDGKSYKSYFYKDEKWMEVD